MTAQEIYEKTLVSGGVTFDLLGNVPIDGFTVSELGGVEVSLDEFSVQDIERIVAKNKQVLYGIGIYVGTWIDKKTVYVDCSVNFTNLGKALDFARRNGQKTIYSVNTQSVILL